MNSERVTTTAAQRMLHTRYDARTQLGMADVINLATRVMRDRARRLIPSSKRHTTPTFELLIVNDELADLAACLSDRNRRDATGREINRGARW
jgi:hypothetical protein